MPRRKFPSDHRPWFRVLDDILDDDNLGDVSEAAFATYIRLHATLNRTDSKGGVVALGTRGILRLTRCQRRDYAIARLRELERTGLLSVTADEHPPGRRGSEGRLRTVISVRNWAKTQGFAPPKLRPLEKSRVEESREPPIPPASREADVLWGEVNDARSQYLPQASQLTFSKRRRVMMAAVRKEFGETAHVDCCHGYIAFHLTSTGDFDPMKYFTPETFWKASGRAKYLDADQAARDSGLERPYTRDQVVQPRAGGGESSDERAVRLTREYYEGNAPERLRAAPQEVT